MDSEVVDKRSVGYDWVRWGQEVVRHSTESQSLERAFLEVRYGLVVVAWSFGWERSEAVQDVADPRPPWVKEVVACMGLEAGDHLSNPGKA